MGLLNYLYNAYYFDDEEIEGAKKQVEFLEQRILDVVAKKLTDEQKKDRIIKIRQTITALKYYYTID